MVAAQPESVFIVIALAALSASCRDEVAVLNFAERVPTRAAVARPSRQQLRVAIAAMISPKETAAQYEKVVSELGKALKEPTSLVHGRTYGHVNELFDAGKLDLAFLCTGGYLALKKRTPGVTVLAVPQVDGKTTYESLVIVRVGSPATRFADLRGAAFAFTDPLSQTGYLYPASRVKQLGETKDSFFSSYTFVGSHDRAIRAVQGGQRSAAAVDSLVFRYFAKHAPDRVRGLRVLERSPAFGMPPVVASARIPAARQRRWRSALLQLHRRASARDALRALGIDRFVTPRPSLYRTARELYDRANP